MKFKHTEEETSREMNRRSAFKATPGCREDGNPNCQVSGNWKL